MNEIQKLTSISQDLKDFLTTVNWEERLFYVALSIFETTLTNSGSANVGSRTPFIGELASTAVDAAKVFIDVYKSKLNELSQ
jgi:hypothetical protein